MKLSPTAPVRDGLRGADITEDMSATPKHARERLTALTNPARLRSLSGPERAELHGSIEGDHRARFPRAAEALDSFLASRQATRDTGSENTERAYERDLRHFACWALDELGADPLALRQSDIVDFQHHLERSGLAPSTVRRRLAALGAFYRHAVAAEFCQTSPVVDIRRPADPDGRPPTDQAITEEELARLISHARRAGPHEETMLLLGANGLRVCEACGLICGDLYGEHPSDPGRHAPMIIVRGKGRKVRRAALGELTYEAVKRSRDDRNLRERPGRGPLLLRPPRGGDRKRSQPWSRQGVYRLLERLSEAAGLPHPIHPHQLRHTFVTIAAQNEGPIEEVARHAGHASIQTTMRYYRALEEHSGHPTHAVLAAVGRAATGS